MKVRQSNFELIRIIAMLMIVGAHYCGHGVLKVRTSNAYNAFLQGDFFNQITTVLYSAGGKTGVALFFMITGYFLCHKKKLISQKKIICQSLFYMLLLTSVTVVIAVLRLSNIVGGGTSLICCNVNNKGAFVLVLYFGILYGVCGFGTSYYNILRAPFYYLVGAFIRKRNIELRTNFQRCFALLLFVFVWLCYASARYLQIVHHQDAIFMWKIFVLFSDYLMSGAFIPFISISFFLFMASINFSNEIVNKIASTTFGIYLLHDSDIGRKLIWNEIICPEITLFSLEWYRYAFLSITTIVGIFIICGLIDLLRQYFFEKRMECRCESFVAKIKEHCFFNKG